MPKIADKLGVNLERPSYKHSVNRKQDRKPSDNSKVIKKAGYKLFGDKQIGIFQGWNWLKTTDQNKITTFVCY